MVVVTVEDLMDLLPPEESTREKYGVVVDTKDGEPLKFVQRIVWDDEHRLLILELD